MRPDSSFRCAANATAAAFDAAERTSSSQSPPRRSPTTTWAPSSRNRATIAAPIPLAPPVTSTRLPLSLMAVMIVA